MLTPNGYGVLSMPSIYPISFGSDNHSGVSPEILDALARANEGDVAAYGADPITVKFESLVKRHFGREAVGFPVWNGTSANVLSLGTLLKRHESVLCAEKAHIAVDECGAPERHLGAKLVLIPTSDQKITPAQIRERILRAGAQHATQVRAVSITQSTEYGTCYFVEEIREIAKLCHRHGLYLHVDGARLSNAACSLGASFKEMITDAGVDVVSWGATKNGALGAEAVVILRPKLAQDFLYQRKQAMQLASKMRFVSAQLVALYEGGLWKRNAIHANKMAKLLEKGVRELGVEITQRVQANVVFARIPKTAVSKIQSLFPFYVWDELGSSSMCEVRWMTHFRTEEKMVEAFVAAVKKALSTKRA